MKKSKLLELSFSFALKVYPFWEWLAINKGRILDIYDQCPRSFLAKDEDLKSREGKAKIYYANGKF